MLRILMVLKTFRYLRARKLDQQLHQTDHYVAMAKVKIIPIFRFLFASSILQVSTLLFAAQITCWTPYAVLVLWTLVFAPHSLNIYLTLVPSICCKVCYIQLCFQ